MRLALLSLLAVGCWKDLPADGSLRCAPGAQPCPGNYHCADDNRCWHNGHEPDLQGAPPDDLSGIDLLLDLSHPGDAGAGCGADTDCVTGFCTDGVCCDKRCLGQCQSCSSGTCKTAPLGPPPPGRPACTGSGTACGGYCDGLGGVACVHPIGNVSCGAACNGICDGKGNCSRAGNCANGYACGGGACLTSCAGNADCQSGYLCKNSICIITTEIDCLDGIDNNGDGLADCQDPSCGAIVNCVDDPGTELGLDLPSGTCPSAYPSPSPLFQGLNFAQPCAGCTCVSSLDCTYNLQFSILPGCGAGSGGAPQVATLHPTSGSVTTACAPIPTPPPSPIPGSLNPGAPSATARGCSSGGSTTTPSPTWQLSSKWCGGAKTSATCPAGKKCVARPSAGQAMCTRIPNGSTCPAGYQMTQQTWFGGFTDNRTCTSCGCVDSGAGVSCGTGTSDSVQMWFDPGCSGSPTATVSGGNACSDVSSVTHFEIVKSTTGMTFPVCSMPAGSGTAAPANPSLLCCSSCACTTAPCLGGCPSGNFCDGSACTSCNTAAFCGASCVPCAPLGDSCSGGVCKCGGGAACDVMTADSCIAGACRCGSTPACFLGSFCFGGTCV